jgi:uncharacterized protein (DUF1501 family)
MGRENEKTRRDFLKRVGHTVCAGGIASLMPQLNLMAASAQASPKGGPPGYRALVCLYLNGGSDTFNLLMPRTTTTSGASFTNYNTARGGVYNAGSNPAGLGIDSTAMLPINAIGEANGAFGVHPQLADRTFTTAGGGTTPGLQTLFNQGRVAFVANCGPLIAPMSKTQYNNNTIPKPPQLFSHNDQTNLWFIGGGNNSAARFGWGGQAIARVTTDNGPSALSPCISLAGNNRFQIGETLLGAPINAYQMSTGGVTNLNNYSGTGADLGSARRAALDQLLNLAYASPFSDEFRDITQRSLLLASSLTSGLNSVDGRINTGYQLTGTHNPANNQYGSGQVTVGGTNFSNSLLDQLRMVARMIKLSKSGQVGADKQVYFVSLGGHDTHDNQMVNNGQPLLFARISQALGFFWQAMNEIGAQNEVTLFSMTEFGRTLDSNGNGTDHAWGGQQIVMGGAVAGQRVYGRYPRLILNANDDANKDWSFSRGQYIPTTSVDQMSATLSRWMGVSQTDTNTIFPNLVNFATVPGDASTALLGFVPPV